jgi:hypothetical protein
VSQNGSHRNGRPVRRLGAWLAALALAIQIFVLQPHVHMAFAAQPEANAAAHVSAADDHAATSCIICQTLAASGFATLAGAPGLSAISHSLLDVTPAPIAAPAREFPAHPWLSRGPPSA